REIESWRTHGISEKFASRVELLHGTLLNGKDNDKARCVIQNAITLGLPDSLEAYARAHVAPTIRESAEFYKKAIELDPNNPDFYEEAAFSLWLLGRIPEASEMLVRSETLFRANFNPTIGRCWIAIFQGDRPTFEHLYDRLGASAKAQKIDVAFVGR